MGTEFNMDIEKFRELIVYIADQSATDPKFGAVKLNKILYFADFWAYRDLGAPITGAEYHHLGEGPAPRDLVQARDALIADESIRLDRRNYFDRVQHRIIALRRANLSRFHAAEIEIIDSVMDELWDYSGRQVTELSHEEVGWKVTAQYETIEYRTAWLSSQPLSIDQVELGKQIAERHELLAPPSVRS